jgi:hypothetical protein
MRDFSRGRLWEQVRCLRNQFCRSDDLPFRSVLSTEMVAGVLAELRGTAVDCVYTPLTTLLVFLWQVLNADHSCRAAVAKLLAFRASRRQPPCSANTGAYCQARARLPEEFVAGLARRTGAELDRHSQHWQWQGRRVLIFDGSTVSMPDTAANQAEYPQHPQQKPGIGFPLARIAVVFSLACGSVLDLAFCRYEGKGQSELGLLRKLWQLLKPGDLLLTDRYLCSCSEWLVLASRGIDCVARLHAHRTCDFRRGRRLGRGDHLVEWHKPRRPEWMDEATYRALPEALLVRELRVTLTQTGFRSRQLIVATTLLDQYSADELARLYRARWNAELDLRTLKTTMQMDVLRGRSPDIVRKEVWAHLLAYNLIRTLMAEAALEHHVLPRTISFKGALQTLNAFESLFHASGDPRQHRQRCLAAIVQHVVADRPDRYEPRHRKRRPKPYPLMTRPRHELKKANAQKN